MWPQKSKLQTHGNHILYLPNTTLCSDFGLLTHSVSKYYLAKPLMMASWIRIVCSINRLWWYGLCQYSNILGKCGYYTLPALPLFSGRIQCLHTVTTLWNSGYIVGYNHRSAFDMLQMLARRSLYMCWAVIVVNFIVCLFA